MDARRFPNRSTSVRLARRFVADQLSDLAPDLAPDLVEAVTLMVSELATNCVRHADADFTVRVQFEADRVRVVVADDGPGSPQLRSPTPSEPYGRGLQIVSEFSDEWGFDVVPEAGTSVWFSVHLGGRRGSAATGASDRAETPTKDRGRPSSTSVAGESLDRRLEGAGDAIDDQRRRPDRRTEQRCRPTGRQRSRDVAWRCRKAAVLVRF